MKSKHKNIINSSAEYTRTFSNLRGVCYTEGRDDAFSELCNMFVDYSAGGVAVESMPGYRRLTDTAGRVHGIYPQRVGTGEDYLLIHAGGGLFRYDIASKDTATEAVKLCEVADAPGCGGSLGSTFLFLCGGVMYIVSDKGEVTTLSESDGASAYTPLLYKNCHVAEERNLLTPVGKEIYEIIKPEEVTRGSAELKYGKLLEKERVCSVTGIRDGHGETVYIPSVYKHGGESYRVSEIAPYAFNGRTGIKTLVVGEGTELIGTNAFAGCSGLTAVYLPSTVTTVGSGAFNGCSSLSTLYLGAGTTSIGADAFAGCSALTKIYYASGQSDFELIDRTGLPSNIQVEYGKLEDKVYLQIPVCSDMQQITSLTVDGKATEFEYSSEGGCVYLSLESYYDAMGAVVSLTGRLSDGDGRFGEASYAATLLSCRVCRAFDDRLFLTGSPYAKGTVFYCSQSADGAILPNYFSVRDCFTDGSGRYDTVEILATAGSLAVCKSDDDGGGSIFFHTPRTEGTQRTYPVSYVHTGLKVTGPAYYFNGEPLFVTDKGVFTLKASSTAEYRKPICRSEDVNPRICGRVGRDTHLTEWEGYLVMQTGAEIYLGDPKSRRGGGDGYDWYPLCDIGIWNSDKKVYRHSDCPREGFYLHPDADAITTRPVYTQTDTETGETFHYIVDTAARQKCIVYHMGERSDGKFVPACNIASCSQLLFFGTEDGKICVFNSDKRGVAPEEIAASEDFDPASYAENMKNEIHPLFYSHDGHAVRFLAATPEDDCEIPYLEKQTVRGSEVAVVKRFVRGSLGCISMTDNLGARSEGNIELGAPCFDELDFRALGFDPSEMAALQREGCESGWRRHRLVLISEDFYRPFGVYSVSYRYKIKGKLKER